MDELVALGIKQFGASIAEHIGAGDAAHTMLAALTRPSPENGRLVVSPGSTDAKVGGVAPRSQANVGPVPTSLIDWTRFRTGWREVDP